MKKCPHCSTALVNVRKWTICPRCGWIIHVKKKKNKGGFGRSKLTAHPPFSQGRE